MIKFLSLLTTMAILSTASVASSAEVLNLYKVTDGDNLQYIAKITYDNKYSWRDIYNANSDIISNPNLIYPGQVLILPDLNQKDPIKSDKECKQNSDSFDSPRHNEGKEYHSVESFPENPWDFNLNRKK